MRYYKPQDGADWNPMKKFPPNEKCICGSGNKFKKCCGPKQPECVSIKDAKKLRAFIQGLKK